jgi:predicted nucleic acid-binding Zn finger protein
MPINATKPKQKKDPSVKKSFDFFPCDLDSLRKKQKLSASDFEKLEKIFGERVKKALEIIGENRIKQYHFYPSGIIRWVVQGHKKEYLVIKHSFCSCKDFLFNALLRREIPSCYHLLARELAEKIDQYELIEMDDSHYNDLMKKWL